MVTGHSVSQGEYMYYPFSLRLIVFVIKLYYLKPQQ